MSSMINNGGRLIRRPKGYRRATAIAVIKTVALIVYAATYPVWGRLVPAKQPIRSKV